MSSSPRRVALMLDLEWPYKRHAAVFAGAQQYAQAQGWELTVDEYAYDTLAHSSARSPCYDGVIARVTRPLAKQATRLRLPLVNVWASSPVCDRFPAVLCDFDAAGRLRAEHLLARGLRNFGILTARGDRGDDVEAAEFRRVIRTAGGTCINAKVPLATSQTLAKWRATQQSISNWLDNAQLPIGLFISRDQLGRIVAQMCRQRGWRVPQDVAIITGTNEETFCEHPRPSLTSMEMSDERIGFEAARLLGRFMDEKQQGIKKKQGEAPEQIRLPPQGLVVRESTDFFAVDDDLISAALEFIAANCHRRISPGDVARAMATEPKTLQRRFRKVLERPIAKEICRARIERAKRELAQGDRSMTEISRNVGFGPGRRMYEVFLREVGVTPTEYRKQRKA